jgi:hypothetical protein
MREEEADAPRVQQRHKRPSRKTALTSEKEENILRRHRADSGTGDCQESSWDVRQVSETRGRTTVEMSAPAEAEEVVP